MVLYTSWRSNSACPGTRSLKLNRFILTPRSRVMLRGGPPPPPTFRWILFPHNHVHIQKPKTPIQGEICRALYPWSPTATPRFHDDQPVQNVATLIILERVALGSGILFGSQVSFRSSHVIISYFQLNSDLLQFWHPWFEPFFGFTFGLSLSLDFSSLSSHFCNFVQALPSIHSGLLLWNPLLAAPRESPSQGSRQPPQTAGLNQKQYPTSSTNWLV